MADIFEMLRNLGEKVVDLEKEVNKIANLYMNVEDWKKTNERFESLEKKVDEQAQTIQTIYKKRIRENEKEILELKEQISKLEVKD